ncbi:Phosphoribosylformylglycinamidine synthase subunit PurQ [bioreactor metagenome]|uniref:Phosphoribosylformylglycinamidine synthase subunit PurQ n=1 Tax=bioreactor metagenome TaxID=1076179 RepID=A0A645C8L1_9ZZZZ
MFVLDDKGSKESVKSFSFTDRFTKSPAIKAAKPRIFIPVFPGTNCEYDTQRKFVEAGGEPVLFVFKNLTPTDLRDSIDEMSRLIDQSQILMIPGGFSGGDEPDGSGKFIAAICKNARISESINHLIKNRDGLILGICNGFQALVKIGLLPFGEIRELTAASPTLTYNTIGRHQSKYVYTKISSVKSPWFAHVNAGEIHAVPISHGEGRFIANDSVLDQMIGNGQIATQYVDLNGNPTMDIRFNPNGSCLAIEGITSPDGRILGKMGHSERNNEYIAKNIMGNKDQKLFSSGVRCFK